MTVKKPHAEPAPPAAAPLAAPPAYDLTPAAPTTVRMIRDAESNPAPHAADVHPDEVASWADAGWRVAD